MINEMKVILKAKVERLGERGEVVQVADGFARNFLIPKNMAVRATEGNLRMLTEEDRQGQFKENKLRRNAETLVRKLKKVSLTIPVKVGEDEKLFGSVTAQDISSYLAKQEYKIDKRDIILEEPIKNLGVYTVPIKLYKDIEGKVKVWVVKE
jgi:large subunit ribosomal protein L9